MRNWKFESKVCRGMDLLGTTWDIMQALMEVGTIMVDLLTLKVIAIHGTSLKDWYGSFIKSLSFKTWKIQNMYYVGACNRWNVIWTHEFIKTIKLERQTMPPLVLKSFDSFCISRGITKHIILKIQCSSFMCREVVAKGANMVMMIISAKWWVDPWRQQIFQHFWGINRNSSQSQPFNIRVLWMP